MKTVLQFLADEIDTAAQDVADAAAHVAAEHDTDDSRACVNDIRNSAAKLYRLMQIAKDNGAFDTLTQEQVSAINTGVDETLFGRAVYEGSRNNLTGTLLIV